MNPVLNLPRLLGGDQPTPRAKAEGLRLAWAAKERELRDECLALEELWAKAPRRVESLAADAAATEAAGREEEDQPVEASPIGRALAVLELTAMGHRSAWKAEVALHAGEERRPTAALVTSIAKRYESHYCEVASTFASGGLSALSEASSKVGDLRATHRAMRGSIASFERAEAELAAELEATRLLRCAQEKKLTQQYREMRDGLSPWTADVMGYFIRRCRKRFSHIVTERHGAVNKIQLLQRRRHATRLIRVLREIKEQSRLRSLAAALCIQCTFRCGRASMELTRRLTKAKLIRDSRSRLQSFSRMVPWRETFRRTRDADDATTRAIATDGFKELHSALIGLEKAMGTKTEDTMSFARLGMAHTKHIYDDVDDSSVFRHESLRGCRSGFSRAFADHAGTTVAAFHDRLTKITHAAAKAVVAIAKSPMDPAFEMYRDTADDGYYSG